jgi:hypothetical protein
MSDPAWIDGKHHPEQSVEFVYPGDETAPAPVETTSAERRELLRWLASMLNVPLGRLAIRAAALQRLTTSPPLPLREVAKKFGCKYASVWREEVKLEQFLRGKRDQK